MEEVLDILEALDVNSCRIQCEFDPGAGRPDPTRTTGSVDHRPLQVGHQGPDEAAGAPASRVAVSESLQLGPAMSRWTQGVPSTNCSRNLAAVIAPPTSRRHSSGRRRCS